MAAVATARRRALLSTTVQVTITLTATDGTAAYSSTLLKAGAANLLSGLSSDPDFADALTAAGVTVSGVSTSVVTSAAVSALGTASLPLLAAALALLASAWL